jgi:hypothetical protein
MKHNGLLIVLMILFSAVVSNCKNDSRSKLSGLKESNILKGQRVELSATFAAVDLEIIDSLLIFLCYGDQDFFHVYNKKTFGLIGKFGRLGRGPSEYSSPIIMSQKTKINDSLYLITYDNSLRRISFVNILRAINNVNYIPISIYSRKRKSLQLSSITSGVISNDNYFIGTSGDNHIEGRFFCYDIDNDKLTWEPFYPIPKIPPKKMFKDDLYYSYLALKPDSSEIAVAALFFNRIDILNKKGKLKRSILFPQDKDPDFSKADSWPIKGSHAFFTSVSVSQDFIYALNIDSNVDSPEICDTAYLIKVSWDNLGIPAKIYKITPRVFNIEVDEKTNRVFGLNPNNSFIYTYNIAN